MRISSNEVKVLTDLSNLRRNFESHVSGITYLTMNRCEIYSQYEDMSPVCKMLQLCYGTYLSTSSQIKLAVHLLPNVQI